MTDPRNRSAIGSEPRRARLAVLGGVVLLLGGCAGSPLASDPFAQPGTWSETGVNDANLRAMVADPHDLVAGKDAPNSLAVEAARPVGILFSGKRPALPGGGASGGGGMGGSVGGDSGGGGGMGGGAALGGGSAGSQ